MKVIYIEDCLNLLVSENLYNPRFQLEKSDVSFLASIDSQVNKGMALTDRQYNAVVEKCYLYSKFLEDNDIDIKNSNVQTKQPFRQIDRRKQITIEYKEELGCDAIRIRFPFSKKQILIIQKIKDNIPTSDYYHKKGSHEHFISVTPKNLFFIYQNFEFPNFDIQTDVQQLLDNVKEITENSELHVPGVYDFQLKNVRDNAKEYIEKRLGKPTPNNIYKYYDRRELYGLQHFNTEHVSHSITSRHNELTQKLLLRSHPTMWNKKYCHDIKTTLESLDDLDRYPIFIHLPDKQEYNFLKETYDVLKDFVDSCDVSVMFRLDNTDDLNKKFNDYIRTNKLNNPLASNTKVVYTTTKISKPTLESGILPEAWLIFSGDRIPIELSQYMMQCDLIVYNVEEMSNFHMYGYKRYGTI